MAILGLSAYALAGGVVVLLDRPGLVAAFAYTRHASAVAAYLTITGVGFAVLWLADIVRAMVAGTMPANVAEMGMPVNPIHVLDLAFILPAMILSAALLRRRNIVGLVFAVPLMTFGVVMGAAIIAMSRVMTARGIPGLGAMESVMGGMVAVSVYLTVAFLKHVDAADDTYRAYLHGGV